MLWLLSILATFVYVNKGAYDIIVDLNNDTYVTVVYPTPAEFDETLLDNAYLLVNSDDDTARLVITGTFLGDAITRPVTGWMLPDEDKLTSELFGNGTGFDPEIAIAWRGSPAASTTTAFNNGRDPHNDGNSVYVKEDGSFRFIQDLDWNPLKEGQQPLVNQDMMVSQAEFPTSISGYDYDDLNQPIYTPNNGDRIQYMFRPYLRRFNDDGTQVVDDDGYPVIPRFPHSAGPTKFIVLAAHDDDLTHGAWPGLRSADQVPEGGGDHYDLVAFIIDTDNIKNLTNVDMPDIASEAQNPDEVIIDYSDLEYDVDALCTMFDVVINLMDNDDVEVIYPAGTDQAVLTKAILAANTEDDTAYLYVSGTFYDQSAILPVTGWLLPEEELLTGELFGDIIADRRRLYDASNAYAWRGSPAAATTTSFNNGRDPHNDGNSVIVDDDGSFVFAQVLDWNPLAVGQAPLVNLNMQVTQEDIVDEIYTYENLYQPIYEPSTIRRQDIFKPFIRRFNDDGTQMVDDEGKPMIARFPEYAGTMKYFVLAAHTDGLTHGAWAGLRGKDQSPAQGGDHYDVVVFKLGNTTVEPMSNCPYDLVIDLKTDDRVDLAFPTPTEFNESLLDEAYLLVNTVEDTAKLIVTGTFFGDAITRPVTGWMLPDEDLLTSTLFGSAQSFDAAEAVAWRGSPAASTTTAFNNGRDPDNDGNSVYIKEDGSFRFIQDLDWNPLLAGQQPLVNQKMVVSQASFPTDIEGYEDLFQAVYTPNDGLRVQYAFRPFLREFDENGTQIIDENGYPVVPRFPESAGATKYIVLAAHTDELTHGAWPGLRSRDQTPTTGGGDHYDLFAAILTNNEIFSTPNYQVMPTTALEAQNPDYVAMTYTKDDFDDYIDLLNDDSVTMVDLGDDVSAQVTLEEAYIAYDNDTAFLYVKGTFYGQAAELPVTGWLLPEESLLTGTLFGGDAFDADTAYAWRGSPAAAITAAYNNGRDPMNDGNSVIVEEDGTFVFAELLDWNPLMAGQGPLVNQNMDATQGNIEADGGDIGEELEQAIYGPSGVRLQPIFRPFIRRFNDDGTQMVDDDGKPMIARFPESAGPMKYFVLAAHTDELTHGPWPGLRGKDQTPMQGGDHYDVVVFIIEQDDDEMMSSSTEEPTEAPTEDDEPEFAGRNSFILTIFVSTLFGFIAIA